MNEPNMLDYLEWRGDILTEHYGLNEADLLILARISYLPFYCIELQSRSGAVPIRAAAEELGKVEELEKKVVWKDDVRFIELLAESDRFGDMMLFDYVNDIDEDTQQQFAAVTIGINDSLNFVSFSGTDSTIVGWKEDFNMAFMCPVPAQRSAVEYVDGIAEKTQGSIIIGGHSKGGNLAVYSAAFCRDEIKERITEVYNFDGPGFDEKILQTDEFKQTRDKVTTYVPQSSVVGMLLGHEENSIIVQSGETGILQHDNYSWIISRDSFRRLDSVTNGSRFIDHTIKGWLSDMSPEQRESFIDSLYSIIMQTDAHTLRDLGENWLLTAKAIMSSIRNLDDDTRKLITNCLSLLAKNAKENINYIKS